MTLDQLTKALNKYRRANPEAKNLQVWISAVGDSEINAPLHETGVSPLWHKTHLVFMLRAYLSDRRGAA